MGGESEMVAGSKTGRKKKTMGREGGRMVEGKKRDGRKLKEEVF